MAYNTMHRKLYEHVEEAIGLRIIKGEYKIGDTLPNEDALCTEFSVSRGVVREAIKVLQKKGLVQPRPKIGTQIQPRSQWNLFDADVLVWKLTAGNPLRFLEKVTEVRGIIESEAAKLSAERATAEEVAEIQRLFDRLDDSLNDKVKFDYEAYLKADMALHTAILEASNNELLAQIGRTISHAVRAARLEDIRDIDTILIYHPFHASITEAIVLKDPESAYKVSREMFAQLCEHMSRDHDEIEKTGK